MYQLRVEIFRIGTLPRTLELAQHFWYSRIKISLNSIFHNVRMNFADEMKNGSKTITVSELQTHQTEFTNSI